MSITRFSVHAQHGYIQQEYKGAYVKYEDHLLEIQELGKTGLGLAACAREWETKYNQEVIECNAWKDKYEVEARAWIKVNNSRVAWFCLCVGSIAANVALLWAVMR